MLIIAIQLGFIFEKLYIHFRRPFHVHIGLEKYEDRSKRKGLWHKVSTQHHDLEKLGNPKTCFCKDFSL